MENNLAQNKALLAIARSMKDSNFNHTIDEAISTLEDTILEQQAHGRSYSERRENYLKICLKEQ